MQHISKYLQQNKIQQESTPKKRISYSELAHKVRDMVLCNNINSTDENWYELIIQGKEVPEDWNEEEDGEWCMPEIYQSYIITEQGARELYNHTNEIIGYNPTLEVYVWHITHFGTGWDCVFTEYDEDAPHEWELRKIVDKYI